MPKEIPVDPALVLRSGWIGTPDLPVHAYARGLRDEIAARGAAALRDVLRHMMVIREFEGMLAALKATGSHRGVAHLYKGPAHLSIGQEGAAVGSALALDPADHIFGSHRSHGEFLAKGLAAIARLPETAIEAILAAHDGGRLRDKVGRIFGRAGRAMAEDFLLYGFLAEIDRWVLRRYCQWLGQNPQHAAHLRQVNLNLSAPSLLDPDFHQLLDELLDTHRLPAGKLCLEITEMVALAELGTSASWIERLRSSGIKVALDDFGSGFASYAYLRHLPLDLLKIDGTFILGIERDPINRAMVSSMVQIARQLGLQTVAEFVENSAGLECLRELGIDFAQGYFIDQPKPLAELADQASERAPAPVSRA